MSPCIITRNPDGTGSIACTRGSAPGPLDAQGHYWRAMAGTNVRECCLCGLRSRPLDGRHGTEIRYSTDAGATWGVGKPACKRGGRP